MDTSGYTNADKTQGMHADEASPVPLEFQHSMYR